MKVVQEHVLEGQIHEIGKQRLVTKHGQCCNPVELAYAQQRAPAQACRLAT